MARAQRRPAGGLPAVAVRSARRRKPSSTRWLARQLNDPYVAEARRLGYRSRAAFKLIELDERFHLLRPGQRVVDLGCAPGGWTQVAVARVGRARRCVVGVDIAETAPLSGATLLCRRHPRPGGARGDRRRARRAGRCRAERHGAAGDRPCRDRPSAHRRSRRGRASPSPRKSCRPGGAFVAKVFQGGAEGALLAAAEAGLRRAAPRQAAGEPRRIGRDLRRRDRASAAADSRGTPGRDLSSRPRPGV